MNKTLLIAGIIILALIPVWGFPPSGLEWIVIIAQIIIGAVLIAKSRTAKPGAMIYTFFPRLLHCLSNNCAMRNIQ
jgi:hypothetical protein